MDKRSKIEKIVVDSLIVLGNDEQIKDFKSPILDTKIKEQIDSMSLVALSVDIESAYEDVFNKEVRVLNEEDPDFLLNFKTVSTLIEYVNKL